MTFLAFCIILAQIYIAAGVPSAASSASVKHTASAPNSEGTLIQSAKLGTSKVPTSFSVRDSDVTPQCEQLGEFCRENAQTVLNGCYEYMRGGCCCKVWQSGAETCLKPCTCPEECPPVSSDTQPQTGWVGGDPHIHTFNNLNYDCQACGDFTLSKKPDCPKYEIQSHFFIPSSFPSISLVSSAVFAHENAPTIQVGFIRKLQTLNSSYANGTCKVAFYVDGANEIIDPGTTTNFGTATVTTTQTTVRVSMPSDIEMVFGMSYAGSFCYGWVQENLPNTVAPDGIVGLFGTPDTPFDITNDWMTPTGVMLPVPGPSISDADGEDYCTGNWRVPNAAASHFTYEAGVTFADSQDCSAGDWGGVANRMQERETPVDMYANARGGHTTGISGGGIRQAKRVSREIAQICKGSSECEFDGKHLGVEGAKAYLEATAAAAQAFRKFVGRS